MTLAVKVALNQYNQPALDIQENWPITKNVEQWFPKKPWFLCVCSTSLLRTLWEKEKLLLTSNFSISHIVFYLFWELDAIFMKFEIVVRKVFESNICRLGKGLKVALQMVGWKFYKNHPYTQKAF